VLDEMFSFFVNSFDTTIRPQTTDDFEIGTRIQFGPGINFSINLFRLDTEQEIFFNPASFANENLDGDTIRQGVELKVSKQFSRIVLNGSYTFKDTEVDGGEFDGKEIPNVPRHQFTVGAEAKLLEKVRLNVDGTYVGERPYISDFANVIEDQDGYFYATAKLAYMFQKGSAYLTVNNMFDEEYYEYGGINFLGQPGIQPAPGINILVGVTFEI
jgi:outer membrane receptor protein involved in Fe transport